MQLPSEWSEFISLLLRHRVRFLLIGAHALAAHGRPRATMDLDVFVEASAANVRKLAGALADFGFTGTAEQAHQLSVPDRMLRLGREPLRIDILNQISGVTFATAWKNRSTTVLDGHRIQVIGLSDLRRNKKASGRTKDLLDVALLDEHMATRAASTRAASRSRRTRR